MFILNFQIVVIVNLIINNILLRFLTKYQLNHKLYWNYLLTMIVVQDKIIYSVKLWIPNAESFKVVILNQNSRLPFPYNKSNILNLFVLIILLNSFAPLNNIVMIRTIYRLFNIIKMLLMILRSKHLFLLIPLWESKGK